MSGIIPFDFESHAVRSVMIDGAPWFVAADVCRVLEHSNPSVAIRRLDDDEKQVIDPNKFLGSSVAGGGAQKVNIITQGAVIALTLTSTLPVAKRLRRWITDEVIPALIRDGYYAMPGVSASDAEDLAGKRAYVETLPEGQRAQAQQKVRALERCRALIEDGARVSHAVRAVAQELGVSEKTVWNYRGRTYMVPRSDWEAACAPQWRARAGGMMVECHPEALRFFMDLAATRARITDCYRRTVEVAAERGWHPVPGIHVLRRHAARVLSTPVRRSVSA